MHVLYVVELQELHSAEQQMADVLQGLAQLTSHGELGARFAELERELRARAGEIEGVLAAIGAPTRTHPDQAMRALLNESRKIAHIPVGNVRDAALVASVQRLIHYKIAGYGTIASYASALGRTEEAARFKTFGDADKSLDADLSEIAKRSLNPDASRAPEGGGAEMRTH
jgi:ferritin-like metal-binding protein YciE